MFDDLPPDLDRLRTLRVWHALWVRRIDAKIEALQLRQAEQEHGRANRPQPAEWVVEVGIGSGKPPVQVHAGHCHMIGSRRRPISRDEARRLLADGLRACTHCRPDAQLHIVDLAAGSRHPLPAPAHLARRASPDCRARLERSYQQPRYSDTCATRSRRPEQEPPCPLPRRSPNRTRPR